MATPDIGQETEIGLVRPDLKVFWLSKDDSEHSERTIRVTEE